MNVFYNKKGIGDVLLIVKENVMQDERAVEQSGDVIRIRNTKTGALAGINILNASTYGELAGEGAVDLSAPIKELIKKAFSKNGLTIDFNLEQKTSFIVGLIEDIEKHANADKLSVCQVNIGDETLQIVCGAPNVDQGQKVVVAQIGTVMPSGLLIKKATLRGVESNGMICSAKELGIQDAPSEKGILILPMEKAVGSSFNL